jgi:hypothetical protein
LPSDNRERLSQENGILLSPTFDKLFDSGFISFRDTGALMFSNHFSDDNFKRVNFPTDKVDLMISSEMKTFLEFHRDVVFIK